MNRAGTLVLGLDQEPPTLDPHASLSAVTDQIIASVTRPTASSHPWLAESWTTFKDCVRYERAFDRCGGER
jgi:ABC-type transport system substrate-binding protein